MIITESVVDPGGEGPMPPCACKNKSLKKNAAEGGHIHFMFLAPPPRGRSKGGGTRDAHAPGGPNSFNFMHFLGKFGKIVC